MISIIRHFEAVATGNTAKEEPDIQELIDVMDKFHKRPYSEQLNQVILDKYTKEFQDTMNKHIGPVQQSINRLLTRKEKIQSQILAQKITV